MFFNTTNLNLGVELFVIIIVLDCFLSVCLAPALVTKVPYVLLVLFQVWQPTLLVSALALVNPS